MSAAAGNVAPPVDVLKRSSSKSKPGFGTLRPGLLERIGFGVSSTGSASSTPRAADDSHASTPPPTLDSARDGDGSSPHGAAPPLIKMGSRHRASVITDGRSSSSAAEVNLLDVVVRVLRADIGADGVKTLVPDREVVISNVSSKADCTQLMHRLVTEFEVEAACATHDFISKVGDADSVLLNYRPLELLNVIQNATVLLYLRPKSGPPSTPGGRNSSKPASPLSA